MYPADIIIGDNRITGEEVLLWLVIALVLILIVYFAQRIIR